MEILMLVKKIDASPHYIIPTKIKDSIKNDIHV